MADWLRSQGKFRGTIIPLSPPAETCSLLSPIIGLVFPRNYLGIEMHSWSDEVDVFSYMSRLTLI